MDLTCPLGMANPMLQVACVDPQKEMGEGAGEDKGADKGGKHPSFWSFWSWRQLGVEVSRLPMGFSIHVSNNH